MLCLSGVVRPFCQFPPCNCLVAFGCCFAYVVANVVLHIIYCRIIFTLYSSCWPASSITASNCIVAFEALVIVKEEDNAACPAAMEAKITRMGI